MFGIRPLKRLCAQKKHPAERPSDCQSSCHDQVRARRVIFDRRTASFVAQNVRTGERVGCLWQRRRHARAQTTGERILARTHLELACNVCFFLIFDEERAMLNFSFCDVGDRFRGRVCVALFVVAFVTSNPHSWPLSEATMNKKPVTKQTKICFLCFSKIIRSCLS